MKIFSSFLIFSLLFVQTITGQNAPPPPTKEYFIPDSVVSGNILIVASTPSATDELSGFLVHFSTEKGTLLTRASSFPYPFDEGKEVQTALIPMSCTWDPGKYKVSILDPAMKVLTEKTITVEKRAYESMDIALTPALTNLITKPDPQKVKEAQDLAAVYQSFSPRAINDGGPFLLPLEKKFIESAYYGDRRRFVYSNKSSSSTYHWGLDMAANRGTPVVACGGGRVVMARKLIVTGNTVVIEHLPGVFTTYMHMDEIFILEGSMVERGDQVGLLGTTGLSTGPHLHWEIRVNTTPVEPKTWLQGPILDKDRLKAIMTVTPQKGR